MPDNPGLTTAPIPRLIRQIAVPASIGFFFNTMYNVVDTYFGGLISTQVLAAMSLSFPVFFIIIATGHGISIGTTALIGSALGASNTAEAKQFAVQGITFGVLVSVVLTVFGLYVSPRSSFPCWELPTNICAIAWYIWIQFLKARSFSF